MEHSYKSFWYLKNKKRNLALDFISSMSKAIFDKTIEQMKLLEIYGIDPQKVSIKKFQNGIWKIRTKDSSHNVRLFFYIINNNIYYLYGFYKSTQKTPEGKKITINNLKKDLLNSLEQDDFQEYLLEITYNEME